MTSLRVAIRSDISLRGPWVLLIEMAAAAILLLVLSVLGLLYAEGGMLMRIEACVALGCALNWVLSVPLLVGEACNLRLYAEERAFPHITWRTRAAALLWLLLPAALVIVWVRECGIALRLWPPSY